MIEVWQNLIPVVHKMLPNVSVQGLDGYQIDSRLRLIFIGMNGPVVDDNRCKIDKGSPEHKCGVHPVAIHQGDEVLIEPSDEKAVFGHGRFLFLLVGFDPAIICSGIEGNSQLNDVAHIDNGSESRGSHDVWDVR
jgi:hypothetical protein